jgi:nucleotide-binding universal stress UspA family protein
VDAPFTDILVPLDGSSSAERALGPALELARRTGVPLRVLSRALSDDKEELTEYLAGVADRFAGEVDIETLIVDRDSIPDAIAEGIDLDTLVCMSSHGRGGLARAMIGSVAEGVLRTLFEPALVVGPNFSEGRSLSGRVVACVDGSDESQRTIEPARRWAQMLDAPLWLVEVVEPEAAVELSKAGDVFETAEVARLARRVGGIDGWDVLHGEDPDRALADMAASATHPVGVLVMATHGRTGWDRVRLGSVTASTVRQATAPVLVVPAGPPR